MSSQRNELQSASALSRAISLHVCAADSARASSRSLHSSRSLLIEHSLHSSRSARCTPHARCALIALAAPSNRSPALARCSSERSLTTAFRHPLFFAHISVSLYGKSGPAPTGFHTFFVVRTLITTCWVSSTCSKIGPAPIDPSRSLACY